MHILARAGGTRCHSERWWWHVALDRHAGGPLLISWSRACVISIGDSSARAHTFVASVCVRLAQLAGSAVVVRQDVANVKRPRNSFNQTRRSCALCRGSLTNNVAATYTFPMHSRRNFPQHRAQSEEGRQNEWCLRKCVGCRIYNFG